MVNSVCVHLFLATNAAGSLLAGNNVDKHVSLFRLRGFNSGL